MTTPAAPETPVASTGPVARDAFNPSVIIPIYAGGEAPVVVPPSTPGDRGDSVDPAAAAADPVVTEPPVAAPAAAESAVTPPVELSDPVTPPATTEPPPTRNDKGQFIPRARFNEVNEERKRLEAENAALKAGKTAAEQVTEGTYDFDAKEKEYANMVLDGKVDEAIALRKEIRAAERADYVKDAAQTTVETTKQLSVKERIDTITSKYEGAMPQFDPESEHYSDELLADVKVFYAGALQTGQYPDAAEAFQASIEKALKLHGLALPAATPPAVAAPAEPAAPVAPARTAEKRVQAIVNQPPSLAGIGTSGAPETHATIDIKSLTDADLLKLPPATRARMRGDFV